MTQWQPQQIERLKLIGVMFQFHRDDRPLDRLAARLQVDPAVLLALEGGKWELLPPPKQTRLIIQHYARVLGVEYLQLDESLPLFSSEAVSSKNAPKTESRVSSEEDVPKRSPKPRRLSPIRMWKRVSTANFRFPTSNFMRWPSKRRWKRVFSRRLWQRFPSRLSAFLKVKTLPSWKNIREQRKLLQLWLGMTLFLGACLAAIVAIAHLLLVLFSTIAPRVPPSNLAGILWLGIFEFFKVFLSFVGFFALLLGLGSLGRSSNSAKVPPNDSKERNGTPRDR
ncbi:MAG: helix-turn-helix domain-containing protein [Spirulina sp.]